jgi:hypothetical protein
MIEIIYYIEGNFKTKLVGYYVQLFKRKIGEIF